MTTINRSPQPTQKPRGFWEWLRHPLVAAFFIVLYLVIAVGALLSLDRADTLFPLYSLIVFPAFVMSPMVILASPLAMRLKITLIAIVLLIAMPVIGIYDSSYLELAIQISIFAGLALGLNVVVGFAGLLDLGYIAFFAVGAYLWAMFTSTAPTVFMENGWVLSPDAQGLGFMIFIVIGVIAAAAVGVLLGLPVLRLRGDYLAIVTLGFGELIRILARNGDDPINFTNGSQGLLNVGRPLVPPSAITFVGNLADGLGINVVGNIAPLTQQLLFYFIAIAMLGVILIIATRLQNSVIGRAWTAIREDEVAAIAMGVPLVKMKLIAFATGAAFAGAIGVLYGAKQTFVSPDSFSLLNSISILAMVIVGGLGSVRGVLLGAVVVTLLQLHVLKNFSQQLNTLRNIDYIVPILNFPIRNWPSELEPVKYEQFLFGLLLILMMLFRPKGLLPETRRKLEAEQRALNAGTPSSVVSAPAAGD
ncbi:MAG: branched-chain amino acid ABC transporter permease [Chloroflexota bacterium]|nr:branched-chain amino acid ABC transporter permease [Chloroflexota bacterium]